MVPSTPDQKSPQSPPPKYGSGSQNPQTRPLFYQSQSQQPSYPVIHGYERTYAVRGRESICSRFCKALILAGAIWLLLSMALHTLVFWTHNGYPPWSGMRDFDYPVPSDISLGRCVSPDDWSGVTGRYPANPELPDYPNSGSHSSRFPFKSSYSFDVPLTPDALWFVEKGYAGGNVDFVTSPDQKADQVKYEVIVHYVRERVRDLAEVCIISKRGKDEHGVGIFTQNWRSHWGHREESLFFETTITFPEPKDGRLILNRLETETSNTVHRTSHLAEKLLFEKVNFRSSNSPMLIFSLAADEASVTSSNSPIRGIFNTTGLLMLRTSNAHIKATVGLTSNKTEPKAVIRTSNGHIEGDFSLFSTNKNAPGSFQISATTSNAPLRAEIITAPVNSTLRFDGRTSNALASANLHPTYEGTFLAHTSSSFPVDVRVDNKAEDPTGKKQERKLIFEGQNGRGVKTGYVAWGDKDKKKLEGSVDLKTSNSPVHIQF